MRGKVQGLLMMTVLVLAAGSLIAAPAYAQGGTTPPDLSVCDDIECEALPESVCSSGGFKIGLKSFTPANDQNSGTATYTYEICSPDTGICNGTVRNGESCLENSFCQNKGSDTDPTATCSRECAIDEFRGLSHFDVTFPELGTESCLGEATEVSGTCSTGNFVLGDGSCFDGETSKSFVAKCDNTSLNPGECLEMTVEIAGELTGLGKGAAIVVDKESTSCTASCIAGPSCEPCEDEPPPEDEPCLTRTLGFWGTHPHIAERYDPVTVCEHVIDGQSAETCSTSEALCTSALDRKGNPNYLQLVAQLTAAKLNLNATAELADATCGDFVFNGESIQDIIARCDTEALCGGNKQTISNSGCIEALNAFNNSGDTGFDQTPAPFDKPGPAQVNECQAARGNGKAIGYGLCTQ